MMMLILNCRLKYENSILFTISETTNEIVCGGKYALKKKESYWLAQTIIAHGPGSAVCWKTRTREKNSRTTEFTLADSRAIQQTRQSIVQFKLSLRKHYQHGGQPNN